MNHGIRHIRRVIHPGEQLEFVNTLPDANHLLVCVDDAGERQLGLLATGGLDQEVPVLREGDSAECLGSVEDRDIIRTG